MSARRVPWLAGLLLTGVLTTAACGRDSRDAADSTPAPDTRGTTAVSPSQGLPADGSEDTGLREARQALRAFMRRSTVGDVSACGHVAPGGDFERQVLEGDCRQGVTKMPHNIKPDERRALVTVEVSGGSIGAGGEVSIPFSGLSWSDGDMTVHTVQPVFVLRRTDGQWKIIR